MPTGTELRKTWVHLWTDVGGRVRFGCTPMTAIYTRMIDRGWNVIPAGDPCLGCDQAILDDLDGDQ